MAALEGIKEFVEGVQVEMRRVTWPDAEQLRSATIVILVFVLILSVVIGAMDAFFSWFIRMMVGVFGG